MISKHGPFVLAQFPHIAMLADLLAICFQPNYHPWVWLIFPFIPSSENKWMCTNIPMQTFLKRHLPFTWNNAEASLQMPRCRNSSLWRSVCSWSSYFSCTGITMRVSNLFKYLFIIGQHLKNLHVASLFEEHIEIWLQMWPEPPQSISASYHMICIDVRKW